MAKISRTDSGFRVSTGGKRNRLYIDISTSDITAWARRNSAAMPRLVRTANASAAKNAQDMLKSIMKNGGGENGVPQFLGFEPFTVEVRALRGTSNRRMGGVLAEPSRIVKYKRGNDQIVGWPDPLAEVARKFQEGIGHSPDRFEESSYRRAWHKQGVASVPSAYTHKERDVVRTFARRFPSNMARWRKSVLEKMIVRQMLKGAKEAANG